jgi:hypothetical protein
MRNIKVVNNEKSKKKIREIGNLEFYEFIDYVLL